MLNLAAAQHGFTRTLLLLAKQNADKPVVGASLVQRLQMMQLVAAADPVCAMHCGVTAHPLFVDKAAALQSHFGADCKIYVLVGYDTWVRITDPKYYPEGALNDVLARLFEAVNIVVTSREVGDAAGDVSVDAQRDRVASLAGLANGRLHFLCNDETMAQYSSSALRTAIAAGEPEVARGMLPECLVEFVGSLGLYDTPRG
eukprot:6465881-Prymnesium_polylepis.1